MFDCIQQRRIPLSVFIFFILATGQFYSARGNFLIGSIAYVSALILWGLWVRFKRHQYDGTESSDTDAKFHTPRKRIVLYLVLIVFFGAFLRCHKLNTLPDRLWHDEKAHLQNVRDVVSGRHAVFFPENNGRESLFIYLLTVNVHLFGETPWAVRLCGVVVGTLTIPLLFLLVRRLFSVPIALVASFLLACNPWHIIMSRIAYRLVLTLPLLCLVWLTLERWRSTRRIRWLTISAICTGVGFYTYSTFRFVPFMVAAFWCALIFIENDVFQRQFKVIILFFFICLLTAIPLIRYAAAHPEEFNRRWEQVSSFNRPDPVSAVAISSLKTCLMVNYKGCSYKRYNVPDQPVLPHWMSYFFPLGLILVCYRARTHPAMLLVLIWLVGGLLPGMITWPAPWFSRTILALPPILILTAIGMVTFFRSLRDELPSWCTKHLNRYVIVVWIVLTMACAYHAVFNVWSDAVQSNPEVGAVMVYHPH